MRPMIKAHMHLLFYPLFNRHCFRRANILPQQNRSWTVASRTGSQPLRALSIKGTYEQAADLRERSQSMAATLPLARFQGTQKSIVQAQGFRNLLDPRRHLDPIQRHHSLHHRWFHVLEIPPRPWSHLLRGRRPTFPNFQGPQSKMANTRGFRPLPGDPRRQGPVKGARTPHRHSPHEPAALPRPQ